MQVTTLKNPGQNPLAQTIRKEVARVISQLEIADVTGTPETAFSEFLADAASKAPGYVPVASPTAAIVPNGGTVNVENSAGNLDSPATATVAAGVLTGVKLGATKTIVTSGDSINVENSAGALDSPATAVVAAGVITGVNLGATKTIVTNAGAVTIKDSSGGPSLAGTANVAAGALTDVQITSATAAIGQNADVVPIKDINGTVLVGGAILEVAAGANVAVQLPPTSAAALVANTLKKPVGTVSGSGTFGTFSVVNGVITGIVLSAS